MACDVTVAGLQCDEINILRINQLSRVFYFLATLLHSCSGGSPFDSSCISYRFTLTLLCCLPLLPLHYLPALQPIRQWLTSQREKKLAATSEEKETAKAEKASLQLRYGFAVVDGHIEKMGNYTVEPPGLFRGRGLHPKMGTHKKRVMPEDITINVGA